MPKKVSKREGIQKEDLVRRHKTCVPKCSVELFLIVLILGIVTVPVWGMDLEVLPALTPAGDNASVDLSIEWDGTVHLSFAERDTTTTVRLQRSQDFGEHWNSEYDAYGLDGSVRLALYSAYQNGTVLTYVDFAGARRHANFYNTSGQTYTLWWDDAIVGWPSLTGAVASDAPAGFRYFAAFPVRRTGNNDVLLYSTDTNAFGWYGIPSPFSGPNYHASQPSIDHVAGRLHVVCQRWSEDENHREIFYSRSDIGDYENWESPRRLSRTDDDCHNPRIAGAGNCLIVLWEEHRAADVDINYCTSTDGGRTWSGVYTFADGMGTEEIIDVFVEGSYVHVLYQVNGSPHYRRGLVCDRSFETPVVIPPPPGSDWFQAEAARARGAIVANADGEPFVVLRAANGRLYPVRPKLALGAELCKSTDRVDFGTTAVKKEFEVWNCGGGTLNFTAGDNRDWMELARTSGSSTGEHVTIAVLVDRSGLDPDHYIGTITITARYPNDDVQHYVTVEMDVTCSPATAPMGLSATDGEHTDRVRISWDAVPGATRYEVHRAHSRYGEYYKIKETATTIYDNFDVTPGETYWYKVMACNDCGCSDFSESDSGYARAHSVSAPNMPTGPGTGEIDQELTFETDGATCSIGHAVEYSFDWGDDRRSEWDSSTSAEHAYSTHGVYYIRAQARCAVVPSIVSEWSYAKTVKIGTIPASPTDVEASDGAYSNKIRITWDEVNGASRYELYRADSQSGNATSQSSGYVKIHETGSTVYDDTDVTPGATYWYKLKACNDIGCSGFSDVDSGFASEHLLGFVTDKDIVKVLEASTVTFQVKLSAQPSGTVEATVARADGDTDITVTDGSSLTFTPDDWNTYQAVKLAAAEDDDTENGSATIRIHRVSGDLLADKEIEAIEDDRLPTYNTQESVWFDAQWSLISLGIQPDDPDPAAVFDEVIGDLKLHYWNAETETWETTENGQLTALDPFAAYWLWLPEGVWVAVEGTPLSGVQRVTLGPAGGQMIGVPYEVAWGTGSGGSITVERVEQREVVEVKSLVAAVEAGWIYDTIWLWSNPNQDWISHTVTAGVTLDRWSGGWIYTFIDYLVLRFSPTPWLGSSAASSDKAVPDPPRPEMPAEIPEKIRVINVPNPITDVHTTSFRVEGIYSCEVDGLFVEVFDLSGRRVWSQRTTYSSLDWHTQNAAGEYLANGVYLFRAAVNIDGDWVEVGLGKLVVAR